MVGYLLYWDCSGKIVSYHSPHHKILQTNTKISWQSKDFGHTEYLTLRETKQKTPASKFGTNFTYSTK